MIKAVLDTNIIVSATIVTKGNPAIILDLWRKDKFEIVITPTIIDEMWQVIFRPIIQKYRRITENEAQDLLFELQQVATTVYPDLDLKVITKDPTDNKYIIAAVEGQADYIVSADQHLLELGYYQNVKIVSPREFVKILENE